MTSAHAPDPVRGLAVAADDLRVVVDDPELRRGRTETLTLPDRERTRRDGARLRRRAREAHAPDPRPARPDRLPAPAPRAGRGRQLAHARAPRRRGLLPPVRRLLARRREPARWPPTCASTAPPTCVRCPRRPRPRSATAATTCGSTPAPCAPARRPTCAFTITKDGEPVRTEPYLGAGGHLVALRDGDLAFLHVHPGDDGVRFAATFPTAGRYRLFLQFQHDGRVHTVAFTQEVS